MPKRYQVTEVKTRIDGPDDCGAEALENYLNSLNSKDQLIQIIPYADGDGFTLEYLVVVLASS